MIESSTKKKKMFYMIVLILTLITMIIGATLAYFSLIASQKENGTTLYTGTLQISYHDDIYIKNPSLLPMDAVSYNTYDDVYRNRFSVSSIGTLNQYIYVDLDIDINEFMDGTLKYSLYNENANLVASGVVPKEGIANLTKDIYLKSGETATYTLIVWLSNMNYNQNSDMGKRVSGRINVKGIQAKN